METSKQSGLQRNMSQLFFFFAMGEQTAFWEKIVRVPAIFFPTCSSRDLDPFACPSLPLLAGCVLKHLRAVWGRNEDVGIPVSNPYSAVNLTA